MAHHQPKVQVLVVQQDKGILYESPFPKHFWNTNFTDILSWPFTKSTDHVVSNLKIILLTVIGLVLLWTLYRILKRLGNFISSLWVQSEPNEWLVVIRNGNFVKAGVGLKTFIGPWDSVVTFPSKVERISFLANNVTLEMQGVNINGVAFWSVHREEDGPFKCYKYMQGGDANQNVKTMCESILRNLIANSKLEDVLRKRDLMKDTMRKELEKPLKGWGIWLESVEITQVRISSKTLFQEMQAQFRNQTKIKAQKSQFEAQEKINEEREKTQLKISQLHQQNQTKKDQQSLTQQLQRIKQKNHYDTENDKFQLEKLQRNKKLEMQRLRLNQEEEEEKLKNQLKINKERDEYQEDKARRKIQIDSLYKDTSLIKYQIDAMERIYQALGIQEMKINQFVTGNEQTDLSKLLPALSLINSLPTVTK